MTPVEYVDHEIHKLNNTAALLLQQHSDVLPSLHKYIKKESSNAPLEMLKISLSNERSAHATTSARAWQLEKKLKLAESALNAIASIATASKPVYFYPGGNDEQASKKS